MHYNISVIKLATKRTNQNFLKEHIHTERAKSKHHLTVFAGRKSKEKKRKGRKTTGALKRKAERS